MSSRGGRRGPPKTPSTLKVLRGTFRSDRSAPREPKPNPGTPIPPEWLAGAALEAWNRAATVLSSMRVLTTADGDALGVYSAVYARWRQAEDVLARDGMTYELRDATTGVLLGVKQRPEVAIARQLALILVRVQQEFGLTPAARTRVNAAEAPKLGAAASGSDADFS